MFHGSVEEPTGIPERGSCWYEFDGENFKSIEDPTPHGLPDFNDELKALGFEPSPQFPSEFAEVGFTINHESKGPRILVCIGDSDKTFGMVMCRNLPSWLKFMKDYVHPICQVDQVIRLDEMLDKLDSTVFDYQVGIPCVQRAAERDVRQARARKLREAEGKRKGQ